MPAMTRRNSSASSSSGSVPSLASGSSSSSASWSSFGNSFDLLEPVEGNYPRDVMNYYRAAPTKRSKPAPPVRRPECTLNSSDEKLDSIFSFPRNHTSHKVCPRHGIVHDPALALPERDSRCASSTSSTSSRTSSCSSVRTDSSRTSARSLKCMLNRIATSIKHA